MSIGFSSVCPPYGPSWASCSKGGERTKADICCSREKAKWSLLLLCIMYQLPNSRLLLDRSLVLLGCPVYFNLDLKHLRYAIHVHGTHFKSSIVWKWFVQNIWSLPPCAFPVRGEEDWWWRNLLPLHFVVRPRGIIVQLLQLGLPGEEESWIHILFAL